MLESLIITLREGIEAALIVGIVLAALRKYGREDLNRSAYWGLFAAFVVSLIGGIAMRQFHFDEDAYEGYAMLLGAAFTGTAIYWMSQVNKGLKGEIEAKLAAINARTSAAWGVFAFVFLMVAREGIETVLFLSAVSLTSSSLLSALGTVTGLALAIAFGVMFVRGTLKVNLQRFFSITAVILWVVVAQLTISGLHELSEAMVLPSSPQEMALIGPIVHNDVVFFLAILALVLALIFMPNRTAPLETDEMNPAERRLARAQARKDKIWRTAVGATSFCSMLLVGTAFVQANQLKPQSPPQVLVVQGDHVSFASKALDDGDLHRYLVDGVRFLAIKDAGGQIHTTLDACHICGPIGYRKQGAYLECKNCGSTLDIASLGEPGGCNPIPLPSRVDGATVSVAVKDLQADQQYFSQHGVMAPGM